jgi:hypothetical protein
MRRAADPENYLAPITRKDALNVLAVQHKITKNHKVVEGKSLALESTTVHIGL